MPLEQLEHVEGTEEECIDNCFEAAQACEWCATECIEENDPEMNRCIQLCRDVADLATDHARFLSRNSEFSEHLAATCAAACEACAEECEQHDAEHCQVCAAVVRECAESCREMAAA